MNTPTLIEVFSNHEYLPVLLASILAACACALPGNFLVLRRMSMMGDAISHAVLPGLAIGFIITKSRDPIYMLAGAAAVGLMTTLLVQWLTRLGRIDEGAAMGVVFTSLFAIGVILIGHISRQVDLDANCVLYGTLENAWADTTTLFGVLVYRQPVVLGSVLVINALFVVLLFKELRISAFDPALATTVGINANVMHYALMTVVAATTVAAFETVGSILVIAMLIVPAATAHLVTRRLISMIAVSLLVALASAVLGHLAAIYVPRAFGHPHATNTAGAIAAMSGLVFLLALVLAPRTGLVARAMGAASLRVRIAREDILGLLLRREEADESSAAAGLAQLRPMLPVDGLTARYALRSLRRAGAVEGTDAAMRLTDSGRVRARELIRDHRLWEDYLVEEVAAAPDHVHRTAQALEHLSDAQISAALIERGKTHDPHGKPIPKVD